MRFAWLLTLPLLAIVIACSDSAEPPGPEEHVVRFTRAGHEATLTVEIADSAGERQVGLMNRQSLAEDAGMLFIHEHDTETGYWMENTFIPLSIAFVSAGGVIIDIQDMEPQTQDLHRPDQPFRYTVEANQGWFDDNDVRVGDVVQLPVGAGFPADDAVSPTG
jgi:uncharacterized membrane protein (UPF0127 family)